MQQKLDLREASIIFRSLQLKRGYVDYIDSAGQTLVENEEDQGATLCEVVRITAAAGPTLTVGDRVVYVTDEQGERGYILGILETNLKRDDVPKNLRIEALESIELKCGTSSFVMSKDGRVNLRGSDVTSRASRINKIKGAAVKIN